MSQTRAIECPSCSKKLTVAVTAKSIECPKCRKTLSIAVGKNSTTDKGKQADRSSKKVLCPKCNQSFKVGSSLLGKTISCPNCAVKIKVAGKSPTPSNASHGELGQPPKKPNPAHPVTSPMATPPPTAPALSNLEDLRLPDSTAPAGSL